MLQKGRWPFFLATRNVLAIVVIINVLKRHAHKDNHFVR